tara:strand:- start:99 stop:566 length:468 start_codon:yes stop_codon:yes gene_type:complete
VKHNHVNRIIGVQPARIQSLESGMIIRFKYPSKSDSTPLVLFIWNDSEYKNVHGLNLNYLNNYKIKKMFESFGEVTTIKQIDKDEDETTLLSEDYTQLDLPPLTKTQTGSVSEAKLEMKRMYKNRVKPILKTDNIYRTYKIDRMSSIKVIKYKFI